MEYIFMGAASLAGHRFTSIERCIDPRYNNYDKELSAQRATTFFDTGSKSGIQAAHAPKLQLQLTALNQASTPEDLLKTSWGLHRLKGELKGHWAINVSGNWRMVFTFDGVDVVLVDYRDDH